MYEKLITKLKEIRPDAVDAINSIKCNISVTENSKSPSAALAQLFNWSSSPQGLQYWWEVYKELAQHEGLSA